MMQHKYVVSALLPGVCGACGQPLEIAAHWFSEKEREMAKIETATPNRPEPDPRKNAGVDVWPLVIADMTERNEVGTAKYGTPLQANNGRNALVDAYQESLDLVVYLRQKIEEEKKSRQDVSFSKALVLDLAEHGEALLRGQGHHAEADAIGAAIVWAKYAAVPSVAE